MYSNHLIFSQKRFSSLIKREIKLSSRTLLYVTLSIIGISFSEPCSACFQTTRHKFFRKKTLWLVSPF